MLIRLRRSARPARKNASFSITRAIPLIVLKMGLTTELDKSATWQAHSSRFSKMEKANIMTTPQHCPGFHELKHLKSFKCKCVSCGKEKEIFSDEFDKTHICSECGNEIDFSQCSLEGEA
jgi:hypothetical protein